MSFDELFQSGVNSFQSQEFEKASTFFTQALDLQPENTTVLVNLALAQFKAGQVPAAYAYYKKALHIDPYFSVAKQGLEYVKSQIQIREIPHRIETYERARDYFIDPFSVLVPAGMAIILFATWGIKTVYHLSQKKKAYFAGEDPAPYGATNIVLSIIMVLSFAWLGFFKYDSQIQRGIVKLDSVSLRSSPLITGPEILQLYGGLEVRVLRKQDGWLQIEYPGSVAGWVQAESIVEL